MPISSRSKAEVCCCMSSLEFEYVSVAEVCCGMSSLSCGMSSLRFDIVAGLCVGCEECVCAVGWAHPQLVVLWTKRIKLDLCIFCWLADGELFRFRVPVFVCTDA